MYGEKIWMTGAFSPAFSEVLGGDRQGCGHDNKGGGGCGACVLVQNSDAVHGDWKVIVMKKNNCPGGSNVVCARPKKHIDFAVPGFDHLDYSVSNACGSAHKSYTFHTKEQSGTCGRGWHPRECDCSKLPAGTAEQRHMKRGCELFTKWGWNGGHPNFKYGHVSCPPRFVQWIREGSAFDARGVMAMYDNSTSLSVQGDNAASAGQKESGETQWVLQRFALPCVLLGGVLFAAIRVWSSRKPHPSADSEELLELQPEQ